MNRGCTLFTNFSIENIQRVLIKAEERLEKREEERLDIFFNYSLASLLENGKKQVNMLYDQRFPATSQIKLPRFIVYALMSDEANRIRLNDRLKVLTCHTGYTAGVKDCSFLRKSIILKRPRKPLKP